LDNAHSPLLTVEGLTTGFDLGGRFVAAVSGVGLTVARGETVGLVGESGSGKSLTALSLIRLVPPPGRIVSGRVVFEGRDLLTGSEREMERVAEFIDRGLRLLKPGKLEKGDDPWADPAGRDALVADVRSFASAFPTFRY